MQVKSAVTSVFFEARELRQELVVDSLLFLVEKFRELSIVPDAIYPGDSFALPFAMFLSDKLSVPIKTEKFLDKKDKVLVVFSYLSGYVTESYIREKVNLLRKSYPFSPTLIVAAKETVSLVDFQLLKVENLTRVNSYRFLSEAKRNFFYPLEGEFTHYTKVFWEVAKQEIITFERAKRIRDNARRYAFEEVEELRVVDQYPEIALWERFKKGLFVFPAEGKEEIEEEEFSLKSEKLIQVEDKTITSAVTSLLEFVAQTLEYYFPVRLAYSNLEVTEHEGVLMIPRVSEVMGGADLRLEVVLKSRNLETDFKKLVSLVKEAVRVLFKEIFEKEVFRPSVDSVIDGELSKATLYLNWFLDKEMIDVLYRKINRRWLLSRLLYRKRLKGEVKEFLKSLRKFEFAPENLLQLFSSLESLWKRAPALLKFHRKEIKEILDERNLWPLVGVYGLKALQGSSKLREELLSFLLSLKDYENIHQFFAKENRYFVPVITKRIFRPNWERVIRERQGVVLKAEPLNPESPVTYILQSQDGHFLGTLPEAISHYIAAKESSGKRVECRELYFDRDVFSENSYWVEVRCL